MKRYSRDERQGQVRRWLAGTTMVVIAGIAACSSAGADGPFSLRGSRNIS